MPNTFSKDQVEELDGDTFVKFSSIEPGDELNTYAREEPGEYKLLRAVVLSYEPETYGRTREPYLTVMFNGDTDTTTINQADLANEEYLIQKFEPGRIYNPKKTQHAT